MNTFSPSWTPETRVSRTRRVRTRRRWLWIGAIVVVLLGLTSARVVDRLTAEQGRGLAGEAAVTASSAELGTSPSDAVAEREPDSPLVGWQSDEETVGAWIELSWQQPHTIRQIVIVRNALEKPGVTKGFLSFGDGSFLQVALSGSAPETVVPITPRSVDRLRFTASGVSDGAREVIVEEIAVSSVASDGDVVTDEVPDGNAALSAEVSQAGGSAASDPVALRDGSGAAGAAGAGAGWTASRSEGAWVQFDWADPREISSVMLVGSAGSAANISAATMVFDDGTELPVGAVLPEPDRPTILSFMPRVTRSVRLEIDSVDGPGPVGLSELRAYQLGATPTRSPSAVEVGALSSAGSACGVPAGGRPPAGLAVACPRSGSVVDGAVDFQVSAAPGYSTVTATVWPGDENALAGAPVSARFDASGAARLTLETDGVPPGPFTVHLVATDDLLASETVFFQLYRAGGGPGTDVPSSTPSTGRTLAYAEEFNRAVSLSRNGVGADYASAKPTYYGDGEFGDAIFADTDLGFGNVEVVDDRFLRLRVVPTAPGYPDPQGWERTHVGGMLASARQGGSGFSAQYGYFEARMLAPAAPGTWPAFWTLPSDRLVAPTPVEAEFDAVELYGHAPMTTCHATHEHGAPRNDGISQCDQRFATERAAMSWHTYGMAILPTGVTFYVDGQVVETAPQVENGDAPLFFLVNLALGGGWPIELEGVQQRADLYVDYVRVYV